MEPLILTFDVGTQSLRALLVDGRGAVVDHVQRVYDPPYYSLQPTWAEQRPAFYFEQLCAASLALREKDPARLGAVTAAVLTVFRDSALSLDQDGNPLRDCILWLDKREAEGLAPVPLWKRALFGVMGMGPAIEMNRRIAACNWVRQNEPELWARTDKFVMLSSYLNLRLTGVLADSVAGQTGHLPLDYRHRRWDTGSITRDLYGIEQDKLCPLVPSGAVLGRVTAEAAAASGIPEGLPLIATGSDKGCETLGMGVLEPDRASISFGSAACLEFTSKKYFEPSPFLPCYPAVPNDLYNGEVQIYCGYWMLSWFKKNFAQDECRRAAELGCSAEELLDAHLGDVPAGCDGLMLLPHFCAGLEIPFARGAFVGFQESHNRAHVYRAIIEGVNFGLMEGLRRMERRSGQKIKALVVGGGGSRSDPVCQITADMFGLPVYRVHTNETAGLGAAMCAFVAQGVYPDYQTAAAAMVHPGAAFLPDAKTHALYEALFRDVYLKLYPALRPLNRRLGALTAERRRAR